MQRIAHLVPRGFAALTASERGVLLLARKLAVYGIFLTHNSPRSLRVAIRTVAAGGIWMEPELRFVAVSPGTR